VAGEVRTGTNPDWIVYDPALKRLFTINGRSNDATAFDAATGDVVHDPARREMGISGGRDGDVGSAALSCFVDIGAPSPVG
jgi:hypothetical protein